MTRVRANLLLLAAAVIWGGTFVAQSTAMHAIGPLWFVAVRFGIAAALLAPFAFRETRAAATALSRKSRIGFVVIGLMLSGGTITQQLGLKFTTVTNSGFITGLYVIFVPLLTVVFLRKKPHPVVWPGALLAFAGTFLLGGGRLDGFNAGDLLTLLCAGFWALQVFLIGIFVGETGRPMTLCFVQFAVCAALGTAVASVFEPGGLSGAPAVWPEIVFSGVISSGLAFSLQVIGQRHTTAPQAAIFMSGESLFAAFFGAILLKEKIPPVGYLGGAIIFAAMLMVEIVPEVRRKKSPSRSDVCP